MERKLETTGVGRALARHTRFLTHLRRDERGGVAILFGLMATLMMLFIGAAIDLSKWLNARMDTLNAIDSAVLAGARSLQVNPTNPQAAVTVAEDYYKSNTARRTQVLDTIEFQVNDDGMSIEATGGASIKTPFLSFANINQLPLVNASKGEFGQAKVAVGGNGEMDLEVSMMLDVTGSMSGSKIQDLKAAAKDLIDIIIWDDQSEYTSRVALVPFSESVRINDNWGAEVASNGPKTVTVGSGWNRKTYLIDEKCFTERKGTEALTDAAPNGTDKIPRFYDADGKCYPRNAVVIPLSSNKAMLKSAIDGYQADGMTAGHIGTAWAWYMLSPNWAQRVPVASRPASYSLLTQLNSKGRPKLKKIAVLMTDGEYNTEYCPNGVSTDYVSCSLPNGNATSQAAKLCTNMKAKGIEVYTVGFDLGGNTTAINVLRNCATTPDQFYQADNGEQLKQAFRNIALKISDLYLSR